MFAEAMSPYSALAQDEHGPCGAAGRRGAKDEPKAAKALEGSATGGG